jgi:hypothetical protein
MGRPIAVVVIVFLVAFAATVLIAGEPLYLVPALVLVAILAAWALFNRALTKRKIERDGSLEEAMSDHTDPVPSAHLIPDDETALGDTPEAHDELSPHDLPKDHPGRVTAEEQAAANEARGGDYTTRGDQELLEEAPEREESLGVADDDTPPARTAHEAGGSARGPRSGG